MRYLDPKADLTFKRVFGEHPDLVMSLLNALLPLTPEQEVTHVEYLPAEMVPNNPMRKNSIVDVRCRDKQGRQFIVEMQMIWSPEYRQRVLFNASKAYVRQIKTGEDYKLLQPVYSLNLVNDVFEPDLKGYYHYYRLVHEQYTSRIIDGLHLVFVELPKFTPHTYSEKKMQVLWLRYLTEIDDQTREVPADLMANPQVKKAVNELEESAFTDAQLLGYEKFWDGISVEKTLYNSAERRGLARGMEKGMKLGMEQGIAKGMEQGIAKGMEQGIAKGIEQGIAKGMEQGKRQQSISIARKMKANGLSAETIADMTGLSQKEIETL